MQTVIEKKVNNNNLYSLTEDLVLDGPKKFVESGHVGAEVFNYDDGYVIAHKMIIPSLVAECVPVRRMVFVPTLPDGLVFDNKALDKVVKKFNEIYASRIVRGKASFNFIHTIAKSTYNDDYSDLSLNGLTHDYYFEGVDTSSTRNIALTVGNSVLTGHLAKLSFDAKVDDAGNPYIFLNVNPIQENINEVILAVDDTKKNCDLYMSKISSDHSFAPKGTQSYDKILTIIKSLNLWTNVLKDCFLDCMIDAFEEALDCKIDSYFKDSWSNSGMIIEKDGINYFSSVVHPDGKTLVFRDKNTNNPYLIETKEQHTFFPHRIEIGNVKDSIVRFVNLSTLKTV